MLNKQRSVNQKDFQRALNGMSLDYCNIREIVTQLEESSDLVNRQRQVAEFNQVTTSWHFLLAVLGGKKKGKFYASHMLFAIIWLLYLTQANRWKKRGLSLVPTRYGLGVSHPYANVFVAIHHRDGTITIEHAGIEVGQGVNIKVRQGYVFGLFLCRLIIYWWFLWTTQLYVGR